MLARSLALCGALAAGPAPWSSQGQAFAQNVPVITAPSGQYIVPSRVEHPLSGIHINMAGGNAATKYDVTLDCTGCTLTAQGVNISGSGTNHLSIGPVIPAQLNPALATLKIAWPTNDVNANDTVTINAVSGGVDAVPELMAIVVDGNKYLVHSTPANALTRSQQQCQALAHPCDGVFTKYWWPTTANTDGTGAVKTLLGDPCFDKVVTSACGDGASNGVGLSGSEQSALVPVTSVALPPPGGGH